MKRESIDQPINLKAGRDAISEIMIIQMHDGRVFAKHEVPAVFRSQPNPERYPKEHLVKTMHRKLLNRFALTHQP
jgi:hypothetical protein